MGRPHIEPLLGLYLHPAVENAAARKHQRMRTVIVDDGQFEIAIERRGGNVLPHRGMFGRVMSGRIDLNHDECLRRSGIAALALMKS